MKNFFGLVLIPLRYGPVHTTPKIFENVVLFLWLGLPSTLIRHEKGAFLKRSSTRRNLKTPALRFSWTGKILKTELFENSDVTIITWYPWPSFPQTQIQNDRWLLRRSVDGKNLMLFQREISVFNFLWRGEDRASEEVLFVSNLHFILQM